MVLADVLTDEMVGTLNITGDTDEEKLLARLEEVKNRMGDKIKKKATGNTTYRISDVKIGEKSVLNNIETTPIVVPSNSTSDIGSKTLTVTVNQKTGNATYYGLIQGAYYELELTNSKFGIKENATAKTLDDLERANDGQYFLSATYARPNDLEIGEANADNEIKLYGKGENEGLGTGLLTINLGPDIQNPTIYGSTQVYVKVGAIYSVTIGIDSVLSDKGNITGSSSSGKYSEGSEVTLVANCTIEGYEVGGWFEKVGTGTENKIEVSVENKYKLPAYNETTVPLARNINVKFIVSPPSPKQGDYLEYGIGYKDLKGTYNDITASSWNFTPKDGWRIWNVGEKNSNGSYVGVEIIPTGIPVAMFYYTSNNYQIYPWYGDHDITGNYHVGINASQGLADRTSIDTPGLFNNLVFRRESGADANRLSHYQCGYYNLLTKYVYSNSSDKLILGESPSVTFNSGDRYANELFITDGCKDVRNLTKEEIDEYVGSTVYYNNTSTIVNKDKLYLINIKGLNKYGYANNSYMGFWISGYSGIALADWDGNNALKTDSCAHRGLRPLVTLKPVDLEWSDEDKVWKITKIYKDKPDWIIHNAIIAETPIATLVANGLDVEDDSNVSLVPDNDIIEDITYSIVSGDSIASLTLNTGEIHLNKIITDSATVVVKLTGNVSGIEKIITLNITRKPGDIDRLTPGKCITYIAKNPNYNENDENSSETIIIPCKVLYNDNAHGLQIISASSVQSVRIYGESNSITRTFNDIAERYKNTTDGGLTIDARCVGTNAAVSINDTTYSHKFSSKYSSDYNVDYQQMDNSGSLIINEEYWLASEISTYNGTYTNYYLRIVKSDGTLDKLPTYSRRGNSNAPVSSRMEQTSNFRPVFLLNNQIKIDDGDGTTNNPFVISLE